ncbi:hypothetical protein PtA15_2A934 [Puccinia triticina]|uniref:Thioesterase domain-containing protein n=1 Tax=Puccinia triticina TaxID=208348 RepID=A0ABY7CII9_9BASI|nr:uncharacterized protein PtA15_2A934 [Puccinia triticina]WAQ82617.1 hypothetical protein PtA15_2A934 [Puccinia triticina]
MSRSLGNFRSVQSSFFNILPVKPATDHILRIPINSDIQSRPVLRRIPNPFRLGARSYSASSVTSNQADPTAEQTTKPGPTRWKSTTLISLATLSMGYLVGTSYPPNLMSQLVINSFLKPPTTNSSLHRQNDSPEAQEITNSIESQLHELQIVQQLNAQPDRWSSFRPFNKLGRHQMAHSLTYSTLRGSGKFAIPPIVFINKDKTEAVVIVHVGDMMCGHEGIVHGGLLATICDEGLAALAFSNLPNMIGVTASLKLSYKKSVLANQFIILRSWLPGDRAPNGRKVWADGRIENLAGDVLVEAESLFVEPKGAKFIRTSQLKEFMTS